MIQKLLTIPMLVAMCCSVSAQTGFHNDVNSDPQPNMVDFETPWSLDVGAAGSPAGGHRGCSTIFPLRENGATQANYSSASVTTWVNNNDKAAGTTGLFSTTDMYSSDGYFVSASKLGLTGFITPRNVPCTTKRLTTANIGADPHDTGGIHAGSGAMKIWGSNPWSPAGGGVVGSVNNVYPGALFIGRTSGAYYAGGALPTHNPIQFRDTRVEDPSEIFGRDAADGNKQTPGNPAHNLTPFWPGLAWPATARQPLYLEYYYKYYPSAEVNTAGKKDKPISGCILTKWSATAPNPSASPLMGSNGNVPYPRSIMFAALPVDIPPASTWTRVRQSFVPRPEFESTDPDFSRGLPVFNYTWAANYTASNRPDSLACGISVASGATMVGDIFVKPTSGAGASAFPFSSNGSTVETYTTKMRTVANNPGGGVPNQGIAYTLQRGHSSVNVNGPVVYNAATPPVPVSGRTIFARYSSDNYNTIIPHYDSGLLPTNPNGGLMNKTGISTSPVANLNTTMYLDDLRIVYDPLGIEDVKVTGKDLNVYPNPAKDQIRIDNALAGDRVTLVDATGALVLVTKVSGASKNIVDISRVKSGVYFVKIGDKTKKLIVAK